MLAVFDDPVAPLEAASALQHEVGVTAWSVPGDIRVRAEVYSGLVHRRDGDLFGTTVNRVAGRERTPGGSRRGTA